jgi:hypothetical protein
VVVVVQVYLAAPSHRSFFVVVVAVAAGERRGSTVREEKPSRVDLHPVVCVVAASVLATYEGFGSR